jgi:hypothetical protein
MSANASKTIGQVCEEIGVSAPKLQLPPGAPAVFAMLLEIRRRLNKLDVRNEQAEQKVASMLDDLRASYGAQIASELSQLSSDQTELALLIIATLDGFGYYKNEHSGAIVNACRIAIDVIEDYIRTLGQFLEGNLSALLIQKSNHLEVSLLDVCSAQGIDLPSEFASTIIIQGIGIVNDRKRKDFARE